MRVQNTSMHCSMLGGECIKYVVWCGYYQRVRYNARLYRNLSKIVNKPEKLILVNLVNQRRCHNRINTLEYES
jgi:hypothetical protein